MHWFEAIARSLLVALAVLIGAAIVRNVTDTLTFAARGAMAAAPYLDR